MGFALLVAVTCLLVAPAGHAQEESYRPGQNPHCEAGICRGTGAERVTVGRGFHVFDAQYLLLGMNVATSCGTGVLDLEASWTPLFPATNLFTWGLWAAGGYRNAVRTSTVCQELPSVAGENELQRAGEKGSARGRYGGGLNVGWRIFAVDAGYMYDGALHDLGFSRHGFRFRGGVALAHETFTGHAARFRRSCCKPNDSSSTPCECERTPVGLALFLYTGTEYVGRGSLDRDWFEPLFGFTFKVGLGL